MVTISDFLLSIDNNKLKKNQQTFTCSKSAVKTLEKALKFVQSYQ